MPVLTWTETPIGKRTSAGSARPSCLPLRHSQHPTHCFALLAVSELNNVALDLRLRSISCGRWGRESLRR